MSFFSREIHLCLTIKMSHATYKPKSSAASRPRRPALALAPGSAQSAKKKHKTRGLWRCPNCAARIWSTSCVSVGMFALDKNGDWVTEVRCPRCAKPAPYTHFVPNEIDEPRLRLARLLPRRRRDGRGRWLWRLVRLRFFGIINPANCDKRYDDGYPRSGYGQPWWRYVEFKPIVHESLIRNQDAKCVDNSQPKSNDN